MMDNYDFLKLKEEIKEQDYKEQLKHLITARTEYLQNVKWNEPDLFGVPFNEQCDLEIKKIKELKALEST